MIMEESESLEDDDEPAQCTDVPDLSSEPTAEAVIDGDQLLSCFVNINAN